MSRTVVVVGSLLAIACCMTHGVFCQDGTAARNDTLPAPVFEQHQEVWEGLTFFAPLFLPKLFQDIYQLREYITSAEFATFRKRFGDIYAVDAIFERAKQLTWNNAYEALFVSLCATMDHRRVGVHVPLVGTLLWFPLTSEFEDEFRTRVNALPSRLYPDSPRGKAGDRDKLQHFFGSAFLAYLFESREASDRVGNSLEWGEQKFVVDRGPDERDVRANRQGQEFGVALRVDTTALPSRFLTMTSVQEDE